MNVDVLLDTLNRHGVAYILIGGMNFLLRHAPVLTYDVDIWIQDTLDNRTRCHRALEAMHACWGHTDADWGPVDRLPADWLAGQGVYALTTDHGALDVFRQVPGMTDWSEAHTRSYAGCTAGGIPYRGLSDADMLRCQEALAEPERKADRMRVLRTAMGAVP